MKPSILYLGTLLILLSVVSLGYGVEKEGQAKNTDYRILLKPPHHIHAFGEATLTFNVSTDIGESATGLRPIITYQFQGSNRVNETKEGDVADNGDGTYTWRNSFGNAGVYVLNFKFEHEGVTDSNTFPLEISKAGSERVFCPGIDNPKFAYQIRWEKIPGETHSGDNATFKIELKRSINEKVNTENPWLNRFDHLVLRDLIPAGGVFKLSIGSASGETPLTVEYMGMGIYEAKYEFGYISQKTTYWLHVTFRDECGVVDETGETDPNYRFPVFPAH